MRVSNKTQNTNIHNTSCKVYAYVLNMRGQPLMPTTPRKARLLLKKEQARVVNRCPFVIKLNYATGETTQPIKLGTDLGYTTIGFSAITTQFELISGMLTLRKDVSKKLDTRQRYPLQPHDLVKYEGKTYSVKGTHCLGKRVILKNVEGQDKSVAISKVELITYGKGLLFTLC